MFAIKRFMVSAGFPGADGVACDGEIEPMHTVCLDDLSEYIDSARHLILASAPFQHGAEAVGVAEDGTLLFENSSNIDKCMTLFFPVAMPGYMKTDEQGIYFTADVAVEVDLTPTSTLLEVIENWQEKK